MPRVTIKQKAVAAMLLALFLLYLFIKLDIFYHSGQADLPAAAPMPAPGPAPTPEAQP